MDKPHTHLTHRQLILARLFSYGPSKVAAIASAVSLGETTVRKVLKNLVEDGEVTRTEEGLFMASTTKKAAAKSDGASKKGAPKGQREHTLERDGKVLAALQKSKTPLTVEQVASSLDVTKAFAYLSLYRLKRDGKVKIARVEGSRVPVYEAA